MIKRRRAPGLAALVGIASVVAMAIGPATADVYVGGGTAVFKQEGQAPTADEGTLVCTTAGVAVGGGCLPFGPGGFVAVNDLVNGTRVAFQVCIDNNGDGVCTSPDRGRPCPDIVVFSHDDEGLFHNPIGPLPTGFFPGCGTTAPWKGYVVFLCEGVHTTRTSGTPAPTGGHTHEATSGTIMNVGPMQPSGFGDFCGGVVENPTRKRYTVVDLP